MSSINSKPPPQVFRRLAQACAGLCATIWLLTSALAGAAEVSAQPALATGGPIAAAPFAAPEQLAPAHAGTGAVRVTVALLVVIGAVIVAGRMARRMRGFGGGTTGGLAVLGQLPVGPRERAVLIRVGQQQLLLGVAPGQVRTLHVFDDPASATPAPTAGADVQPPAGGALDRPTFRSILMKSLGK
ncbi:MAG TPA: flagellar biosynthetic protein FliO [Steroidobacteraceae bacterium]|nr:flagellar biosynthetic protein FliO [Steroidobacteraceae bacterium]